ncbi:MAG: hypothetical protein ACRDVW_04300 [Acidimicrobiales bacterium]
MTLGLAIVAVISVILFVAGADKNAQITGLRTRGVPIQVTVGGCRGLLGGSGSNAAGYACRGEYRYGGRRYDEAIPEDVHLAPGSNIQGVIAPNDPALLSTAAALREEHGSWRVFITPGVLALISLYGLGGRLPRRRFGRAGSSEVSDPDTDSSAGTA